MFTTTNSRSSTASTTTLRGRWGRSLVSLSYVLANSRSWGGQPTASYSGNGIAIAPENQFAEGECGPTRLDERHRFVASAVVALPCGFEVAPIFQCGQLAAVLAEHRLRSRRRRRRPRSTGCARASIPAAVFAVRGNATAIRALNPLGCQQISVNTPARRASWCNPDGTIEERSSRYLNVDLRITKSVSPRRARADQGLRGLLQPVRHREPVLRQQRPPGPEHGDGRPARSCRRRRSTAPGLARPSAGRSRWSSAHDSSSDPCNGPASRSEAGRQSLQPTQRGTRSRTRRRRVPRRAPPAPRAWRRAIADRRAARPTARRSAASPIAGRETPRRGGRAGWRPGWPRRAR